MRHPTLCSLGSGDAAELDWRNAMLGVLLGVVVQGLLPQEPVRDALQMVLRSVASLFGHDIPQLPS